MKQLITGTPSFPESPWLENDLATRRFGFLAVAFLLLVVGGWSACAPIQSAALASGVVQVEGKRKPLQHLEGGIISQILVANGDYVVEGQALIELDAARSRAELDILQGRVFNKQARVDRLLGERDDLAKIAFSSELQDAAATDARAEGALANETALFQARLMDRAGEEDVLESQRKGLEAVLQSRLAVARSLDAEINDLEDLLSDGYVDKQRLRQLERTRSQTLGEVADLEVAIKEAELQIIQLQKRFKTLVVDELTTAQEELYDLAQQFGTAHDRVSRATIKAPVAGVVLGLRPNTIGAVIGSGEILMEIVPDSEELVVDAQISPMDIDRVRVGQSAEVRFSVFKDAYMVTGSLVKLSADRLIDDDGDLHYYAGEIKLEKSDLQLLGGMALVPGMPAEVLIKTGERTMLGYLTSPMNRLFSRSLIED